jgi:hypothetical protein
MLLDGEGLVSENNFLETRYQEWDLSQGYNTRAGLARVGVGSGVKSGLTGTSIVNS